METIKIKSWDHFEEEISKISNLILDFSNKNPSSPVSEPLYRGQANVNWKLESSLDRIYLRMPFSNYHSIILNLESKIKEMKGNKKWDIPSFAEPKHVMNPFIPEAKDTYLFMAYLRQHGFPSPLLDWSEDSNRAAFFAVSELNKNEIDSAVFVLLEDIGNGKTVWGDQSTISSIGSYMAPDPRHLLQRSNYTVCATKVDEQLVYTSHEEVKDRNENGQDLLYKLIIPHSLKKTFLKEVMKKEINNYVLYNGDEDAFIADRALEQFFTK